MNNIEAFEAWFNETYLEHNLNRDEQGYYISTTPRLIWQAWQAALASQAQQQITKDAIQHGTGIGLVVDGKLQHVKPEDFYLSSEDEKNIKMRQQLESLPFAASQAQQEPLKVSENWREPLSADAMQRLKNLGVIDKSPAPEGESK